MNANPKILSIFPYISTSWKNIASLHVENYSSGPLLIVTLLNGVRIEIPQLETSLIKAIFTAHTHFIEQEERFILPKSLGKSPLNLLLGQDLILSVGHPLKNGLGLEQLGSVLQHNPEQSDSPDLPQDVLQKIAHLSKSLGIDDLAAIPKPEDQCNCMHCQIAKTMHAELSTLSLEKEEEQEVISDEDLKFKTWDIVQAGEKLYNVTNPLDIAEHYHVYLGNPIGCTCGNNHCEHIQAVLKT